jgi:hypothetical protein
MARSRRTSAMLVDRCSCGLSGRELQRKTKSHRLRAERLPSLSGDTVLNGAVSRVLTKNIPITLTLMGLRPGLSSVSPVQVRFEKRLRSINQFPWEATLSFVIPSAPGFPATKHWTRQRTVRCCFATWMMTAVRPIANATEQTILPSPIDYAQRSPVPAVESFQRPRSNLPESRTDRM